MKSSIEYKNKLLGLNVFLNGFLIHGPPMAVLRYALQNLNFFFLFGKCLI